MAQMASDGAGFEFFTRPMLDVPAKVDPADLP
jgi:hypothetical protein